ncbi:hypothetical protein NXW73_20745 [Bacteroides fragilis]|nr:hypothetical protein [Bacteroides fragilis]
MTILKDACFYCIHGSQGANMRVLVITKNGKAEEDDGKCLCKSWYL